MFQMFQNNSEKGQDCPWKAMFSHPSHVLHRVPAPLVIGPLTLMLAGSRLHTLGNLWQSPSSPVISNPTLLHVNQSAQFQGCAMSGLHQSSQPYIFLTVGIGLRQRSCFPTFFFFIVSFLRNHFRYVFPLIAPLCPHEIWIPQIYWVSV